MRILRDQADGIFQAGAEVPAEAMSFQITDLNQHDILPQQAGYFHALLPVGVRQFLGQPLPGRQVIQGKKANFQMPGQFDRSQLPPDFTGISHPASFYQGDRPAVLFFQDADNPCQCFRMGRCRERMRAVEAAFDQNVLSLTIDTAERFNCSVDRSRTLTSLYKRDDGFLLIGSGRLT